MHLSSYERFRRSWNEFVVSQTACICWEHFFRFVYCSERCGRFGAYIGFVRQTVQHYQLPFHRLWCSDIHRKQLRRQSASVEFKRCCWLLQYALCTQSFCLCKWSSYILCYHQCGVEFFWTTSCILSLSPQHCSVWKEWVFFGLGIRPRITLFFYYNFWSMHSLSVSLEFYYKARWMAPSRLSNITSRRRKNSYKHVNYLRNQKMSFEEVWNKEQKQHNQSAKSTISFHWPDTYGTFIFFPWRSVGFLSVNNSLELQNHFSSRLQFCQSFQCLLLFMHPATVILGLFISIILRI